MESETWPDFNVADAVACYGEFTPVFGFESSLNFEDSLLPYPSPPMEPDLSPLPTMPFVDHTSPISDPAHNEDTVVSVSTSFNPTSHSIKPDLVFSTSDTVLFYAHSFVLGNFALEGLGQFSSSQVDENLTSQADVAESKRIIYHVPDSSAVFNVLLHTLYGSSPAQNSPSLETLTTAVDRMLFYGINPKDVITRQTPLYELLLTCAPLFPLQLYSLAGHHGLEDLAVSSSSHLLSLPMSSVTDEMAIKMGAIYLKRLFCLHLNRMTSLKDILLVPPLPHPPTKECGFGDQKALTRAWALVSAHLAWDARPDLSTALMRKAYEPLRENLTCESCRLGLEKRVKDIVHQWARVKVSSIYVLGLF